jgi:polysaccharide pyruvyl transferase WcaK-like protein
MAAAALLPRFAWAADARPRRILLRSSWQTVNIGDIGHTPGILRLLAEAIPDAEVRLWPGNVGDGVAQMLTRNFPKLIILKDAAAMRVALQECDFLLHGSGPALVGKPYGVYGITFSSTDAEVIKLLSAAQFAFFRDSVSLQFAKEHGVTCPVMGFGPDAAFAVNIRNDAVATQFLAAHGLEQGKFLCCIPRLRKSPYWLIRNKPMTDADRKNDARNQQMKEHDHAPLREAIIAVVRQTPMKVLVCPEDQSQMQIGKEMLVDPLPDDVKAKVVWREKFWLTDEAVSTYVRSAGLFGLEMHSPIMCIGNGIPAIVCRFDEQTSKGLMWRDIGLGDWLFDMDNKDDVSRIVPAVLTLATDPAAAKAKAAKALEFVKQRQRETMAEVEKASRPT